LGDSPAGHLGGDTASAAKLGHDFTSGKK